MNQITCIMESEGKLTYGKKYEVVDKNELDFKIKRDDGRTRWYSSYFFDPTGYDAPDIESVYIESEESSYRYSPEDDNTGISVKLTDGREFEAMLFTYKNLMSLVKKNRKTGECMDGMYF